MGSMIGGIRPSNFHHSISGLLFLTFDRLMWISRPKQNCLHSTIFAALKRGLVYLFLGFAAEVIIALSACKPTNY